jgi:hypothetical protein
MGLLGGIARTAVVAGTATAVSNRVSRRQAGRWASQDQQQYDQQQDDEQQQDRQYSQADEGPPQDGMSDKLAQLKQLGELKDQGVLTGAEFEQQKARILGS